MKKLIAFIAFFTAAALPLVALADTTTECTFEDPPATTPTTPPPPLKQTYGQCDVTRTGNGEYQLVASAEIRHLLVTCWGRGDAGLKDGCTASVARVSSKTFRIATRLGPAGTQAPAAFSIRYITP